jgi:hypothetical protein
LLSLEVTLRGRHPPEKIVNAHAGEMYSPAPLDVAGTMPTDSCDVTSRCSRE